VAMAGSVAVMFTMPSQSQNATFPAMQFHFVESDAARDLFNSGRDYFDSEKFAQAENAFREVLRKYAKNVVADRSAYYLIRTLGEQGKIDDAKNEIAAFQKTYPKSAWLTASREYQAKIPNKTNSPVISRSTPRPAPPPNPMEAAAAAVAAIQASTPPPPAPPAPPAPFRGLRVARGPA